MSDIRKLIDYLKNIEAPVVKIFNEGLAEEQVKNLLGKKGLPEEKKVIQLYKTINGTSINDSYLWLQYFFPGYLMPSLEKSLELYEEECITYNSWQEGFLPIFWNGNRDYLLVDCFNKKDGIYFFSPDEFRFNSESKIYDSLENLFITILKCFQSRAYQLGKELSDIKYNGEAVIKISKELNPNSEYWEVSPGSF